MAVEVRNFGTAKDGREIKLFTIKNKKGMQAAVTNIGAILVRLLVPDARETYRDLVLALIRARSILITAVFLAP